MSLSVKLVGYISAAYNVFLVAVPCPFGDVRLAASGYSGVGRIEVCQDGSWGTICSNAWDDLDASIACKASGYSAYGTLAI